MSIPALKSSSEGAFASLFARLGHVLASTEKLEEFFSAFLVLIEETLRVEGCSILLIDESDQRLKIKAATRIPRKEWPSVRIRLGEGIAGKVALTGRTLWAKNVAEVLGSRKPAAPSHYRTASFISVPVQLHGRTLGVINVDSKVDGACFDETDANLLQGLAGVLSSALSTLRLLEERAKASRYFDSILQSVPMGVLAFNNALHLIHCNRAAAGLLGFDQVVVSGAPANAIFPDSIRSRALDLIAQLKSSGVPAYAEIECASEGDKPATPLGLSVWALPEDEGAPAGVLVVIEDLSIRREVAALRHLSEMKSHFLSLISHELRTPLTAIKGSVYLLMETEGMKVSPAQKRVLEIIDRNIRRLASLVDDVLEVQTIETERVKLDLQPMALEALIRECLESRRPLWKDKNVEATIEVSDGGGRELRLDPDRIRLVFIHLLDNAFKFCNAGGKVSVQIAQGPNGIEARISNSGCPIPENCRDQIFEKFYQVESTMTRQTGGAGLGLYLARELARLHGGEVVLERSDQEATTFLARLPTDLNGG